MFGQARNREPSDSWGWQRLYSLASLRLYETTKLFPVSKQTAKRNFVDFSCCPNVVFFVALVVVWSRNNENPRVERRGRGKTKTNNKRKSNRAGRRCWHFWVHWSRVRNDKTKLFGLRWQSACNTYEQVRTRAQINNETQKKAFIKVINQISLLNSLI